MSIPNRQVGWSQKANLYWEISKKLDRLQKVLSGSVLNYPDNAVVTKSGKYITSVDGKYILTVDGFVPLNAMRTLTGNPIVTKSGKYITI